MTHRLVVPSDFEELLRAEQTTATRWFRALGLGRWLALRSNTLLQRPERGGGAGTIPNDLVDNVQRELAHTCASELLDDPISRTSGVGDCRSPIGDLCSGIWDLLLVKIHLRRTRCGEIVGRVPAVVVSSLTICDVQNSCHLT